MTYFLQVENPQLIVTVHNIDVWFLCSSWNKSLNPFTSPLSSISSEVLRVWPSPSFLPPPHSELPYTALSTVWPSVSSCNTFSLLTCHILTRPPPCCAVNLATPHPPSSPPSPGELPCRFFPPAQMKIEASVSYDLPNSRLLCCLSVRAFSQPVPHPSSINLMS